MIKNTLNSFTDNINQKLKNPFLGTFILVWIIRNWEFVYSLFYFDSKLSLNDRVIKIKAFFTEYGVLEILITIGLAFLILIVTYILLNLSKLIVNFFDKTITPKIYEVTDKSSVVVKTTHNEALNQIEQLESRVQSERESRLKIQIENGKLESRIKELIDTNTKKSVESNQTKSISNKTRLLSNKLIKDKKVESFESVASDILSGKGINREQKDITEFATLGLIKPGVRMGGGRYNYTLTQAGNDIHENLILDKLK